MCRSSFRVCIGPPGLQLSQNTTLPFYFSQYSNKFSRISRFDKCERILRSFKLLLVNQQAPCTPSGCLWVLFTQIISAHIKFPQEIIVLTCAIFYTSYAITRWPYAPTSSLLRLGHHTGLSAPQHRPCRSVDFKHIRPTPLWNPLHRINDIDLVRHETDKSLL